MIESAAFVQEGVHEILVLEGERILVRRDDCATRHSVQCLCLLLFRSLRKRLAKKHPRRRQLKLGTNRWSFCHFSYSFKGILGLRSNSTFGSFWMGVYSWIEGKSGRISLRINAVRQGATSVCNTIFFHA